MKIMTEIILNNEKPSSGIIDVSLHEHIFFIIKGLVQMKLIYCFGVSDVFPIKQDKRVVDQSLINGVVSIEFLSTNGTVKYKLIPYQKNLQNI